jgi:hypothetical protein
MDEIAETWTTRELPILRAALSRFDTCQQESVALESVRIETGLPAGQIWAGVQALKNADPPFLEFRSNTGWNVEGGHVSGLITGITERTRRKLGSWPSPESMLESLIQALNAAADSAPEEKRSRLRAAAEALSGMAREIAIRAISARIGQSI